MKRDYVTPDRRGITTLADADPALASLAEACRTTTTGRVAGWIHVDVDTYQRPGDPADLVAVVGPRSARWARLSGD